MLSLLQFGAEDAGAAEGAAEGGGLGDALKGAAKEAGNGGQQGGGQKFDPASTASTASAMLAAGHQGGGTAAPAPSAKPPVSSDGQTALKAASNPPENGAVSYAK
jgi:hypothetical protein